MYLTQLNLLQLFQHNVVEIKFNRRRLKANFPFSRRMLCTNDTLILNSAPGQIALHFKPPHTSPKYNWIQYNLVCTWDLFWADWRMVPCESCDVVRVFPTKPAEEFWNYFNLYLQSLSPQQKLDFMRQ